MASSFCSSTRILRRVLVCFARPEEYAVGHDDGGAAANLKQPQEQRKEQQFGLLSLDDLLQIPSDGLVVETAPETADWRGRASTVQRRPLLLSRFWARESL